MSDIHIYIEREQPVRVITLEPSGKRGPAGPNSVTSATTSDGTCDLSLDTLVVGTGTASGANSVAIGVNHTVSGSSALAIGENCTASAANAIAIGIDSTASGISALAFGNNCTASGGSSFAQGSSTASGVFSRAFGSGCLASENYTHAQGVQAKAIHEGASVESDSRDSDVESTTIDEKTFRFRSYRFLGGSATFTENLTVEGTLTADHIHGNLAGSVYAHVRAGETLAKGDPVYISGSHGSGSNLIPIVSKADASNAAKMPAVGIMDAALANNANGHMVIIGTITQLNTNAYAVNSVLYVATGGGFTSTPPAANSQAVAIVERSNTNNGAIIVKVNGLASNGGNGASDANKLVRFTSTGTIPVASIGGLGTGVATALAVNTGSAGAFVVNGGTATNMVFAGSAAFDSTTRPTSAGTGTPAATSLITLTDARDFLANPSSVILREDFANISTTSNQIGELGWVEFGTGTGQTMSALTSPAPNIGIRRLTSGSTATGNGKVIYLSRIIPIGSANWEICWVAALAQTTDCDMIVGLTNDNAGIGITRFGGKSMGARYSSAVDTNFMFFSKNTDLDWAANDSNNFSISSGVAVNTSYNTFRLRNVNGVYSASINGGSFVTITNTLTGITSNVMFPFFYIATRTTANRSLDVDYFSCIITGLSR
jgi:hypothetical protein